MPHDEQRRAIISAALLAATIGLSLEQTDCMMDGGADVWDQIGPIFAERNPPPPSDGGKPPVCCTPT